MKYTDILVEKTERVAWITLNKPQVKNAMGKQTLIDILAALEDIGSEPAIIVTVIQGAGGTFCTGMDLRERSGPTAPDAYEFNHLADRVFLGIEKFNKITIALVNGYCMAGGLELAMGCDFIVADENCKIGDGHMKLPGFVPNGGSSVRLPRLIGVRKAKELLYTGELVSGKEAERIGLASYAVPAGLLKAKVEEIIARLLDKSPVGLASMKMLIDEGRDCSLEAGLQFEHTAVKYLGNTEDHHEAVAAMKEKRKPVYKGK
jgi:enoyl-CoA hydratase/carnithine racemase